MPLARLISGDDAPNPTPQNEIKVVEKGKEQKKEFRSIWHDNKNDPFWSEENQTRLKASIKQIEEGKFAEHELIEVK